MYFLRATTRAKHHKKKQVNILLELELELELHIGENKVYEVKAIKNSSVYSKATKVQYQGYTIE